MHFLFWICTDNLKNIYICCVFNILKQFGDVSTLVHVTNKCCIEIKY